MREKVLKSVSWGKIPVDFTGNHLVHPVSVLCPSEKFYRLGVSNNKQESVKYASACFNPTCPPLADFLINHLLHETHHDDIADAAIIHLEEHYGFPIFDVPDLPVPSGCEVAGTLTAI